MNESTNSINEVPQLRKLTENESFRFWAKVDKNGEVPKHKPELGKCWNWIAGKDRDGYGMFDSRTCGKAHRLSYQIHKGETPKGMCVCHRCDNPSCVNPSHLFVGTTAQNMADKIAKGRQPIGEKHHNRLHPEKLARGSRAGHAKLTESQVLEIREMAKNGICQSKIGQVFGVSHSAIWKIVHRKKWAHI